MINNPRAGGASAGFDAAVMDYKCEGEGDYKREPDRTVKPLNPVSAAGLEHAVMSLNLGSAGVDDWTFGDACLRRLPLVQSE